MTPITIAQLREIMPYARIRAFAFAEPLNAAMFEFDINTPQRQAAFLAQIAHESGELRYVEELASGKDYEGRLDLGNTAKGDGVRYKGRGLIQITGRSNYANCSIALFGYESRLLTEPELLEEPINACRSAAWFWKSHGCNELADIGNFRRITLIINGGLTGHGQRLAYWETATEVLV
jgi:Predicted chitinase